VLPYCRVSLLRPLCRVSPHLRLGRDSLCLTLIHGPLYPLCRVSFPLGSGLCSLYPSRDVWPTSRVHHVAKIKTQYEKPWNYRNNQWWASLRNVVTALQMSSYFQRLKR
jgi:hypothetical protein